MNQKQQQCIFFHIDSNMYYVFSFTLIRTCIYLRSVCKSLDIEHIKMAAKIHKSI